MNKKNKVNFIDFEGEWAHKRGKNSMKWIEDTFLINESKGKQVAVPQTKKYIGISFLEKRAFMLLLVFLVLFASLIIRVVYIQIIHGEDYLSYSNHNSRRVLPIQSERGLIFDSKGKQLTKNIPNFSLALVPQDLPKDKDKKEYIVNQLAVITNQDAQNIGDVIEKYGNYSYESIIIQEDLDYETALMVQIAGSNIPGIHVQRGSKRLYINESMLSLSHILGYEAKLSPNELEELYREGYLPSDIIGKTGIEKIYEKILRGKYGKKIVEVDARGLQQSVLSQEESTPGKHLMLSIDSDAQKQLERIINNTLSNSKKTKASGIVMDPNSGEIIAMVSLPTYDDNDFSGGIQEEKYNKYISNKDNPLFNRSISGAYPSGSTIKPAIAMAALQEKIITSQTTFISNGGLNVSSWFFPDWKNGGHGRTNVRKSLAESVNTFYYYIGGGYEDFKGLGVEKIVEYLKKLGFGRLLGIDLVGETSGFLPSKEWKQETKGDRWYIGDTYNLSIGQGEILVTPLQIASMTSIIANGGTLYRPRLIKEIIDPINKGSQIVKSEIIADKIINAEYIKEVRFGMRDCVTNGSCLSLSNLPIQVAGKTGTAQWSGTKENHAWFTSFAPFNSPKIVVTILVEEGEEGSRIAAPIAKEFYLWWSQNR